MSVMHKVARDKALVDPTFEATHRRQLMTLKPGEVEESEPIAVAGPIRLKTKRAMVTMYRRLPELDRPVDEDTYELCCDNVYELTTIQKSEEGWVCQNVLGATVSPSGEVNKEFCETSNNWGSKKCRVCFALKPKLRPFFKKLQRLSKSMKARRKKLVDLVTQADKDQTRYEKDLELADYKLKAAYRRREELDKEYYMFLDRSGQSMNPMAAVLADHTCHARFVEFLTCVRNGESVGEDDDEPLIMFHDEAPPEEKKEEVEPSSDEESDTEEERVEKVRKRATSGSNSPVAHTKHSSYPRPQLLAREDAGLQLYHQFRLITSFEKKFANKEEPGKKGVNVMRQRAADQVKKVRSGAKRRAKKYCNSVLISNVISTFFFTTRFACCSKQRA